MIKPACELPADALHGDCALRFAADLASDEVRTAVRPGHFDSKRFRGSSGRPANGQGVMRAGARPPAVPSDGLTAVLPQRSVGMHELVIAYG